MKQSIKVNYKPLHCLIIDIQNILYMIKTICFVKFLEFNY